MAILVLKNLKQNHWNNKLACKC